MDSIGQPAWLSLDDWALYVVVVVTAWGGV